MRGKKHCEKVYIFAKTDLILMKFVEIATFFTVKQADYRNEECGSLAKSHVSKPASCFDTFSKCIKETKV